MLKMTKTIMVVSCIHIVYIVTSLADMFLWYVVRVSLRLLLPLPGLHSHKPTFQCDLTSLLSLLCSL